MTHTVSPYCLTEGSHDSIKCASMLQVDLTLACYVLMFTDWKNENTFIIVTVMWGLVCTHEYSIVSVDQWWSRERMFTDWDNKFTS